MTLEIQVTIMSHPLSIFITEVLIFSNMNCAISGAGTAYLSEASEFFPGF
jgi:hypothetical protein